MLPFLGGDIICPFCASSFPLPAIGFPALRGCIPQFEIPALWLGSVPIVPNEALELPGLELFANDPGPYVPAAEVGSWLPQDGLRYVKVESGANVTRVIAERAGAFEEPGACLPGQCDPFLVAASSPAGDTPEPRSGQAEVLSARRGRLWVLGGEALSDGRPLDDLWAYDLDGEEWTELRTDGRPSLGTVLAATYSAAQDSLWVLDEVEAGRRFPRRRRLLRLDPLVGVGEVIASWPVRSGNDRFALAADAAGTLYVVGWSARGGAHTLARLDWHPTAGMALLGWAAGGGRVIGSTVRASERGVSFYVEHDGARVEAAAYGAAELSTAPGGEHRCF